MRINFYDEKNIQNYYPIDRPLSKDEMDARLTIFKNSILNLINKHHNEFLLKNKIKIEFDPLAANTWHHDFNVNTDCKEIPLFKIPLPPLKENIFTKKIQDLDFKKDIGPHIEGIKFEDNKNHVQDSSKIKKINIYQMNFSKK